MHIYILLLHLTQSQIKIKIKEMKMVETQESGNVEKRTGFCINDNLDILIEILKRLDDRSLGVAACVCPLWSSLTRNDSLWEHLCFRRLSPPSNGVRNVVAALGGYRRLYMVCVKPVLRRLGELERRLGTRHEMEISLSLFCVDYYERVLLSGAGRLDAESAPPPSSLIFLCPPPVRIDCLK